MENYILGFAKNIMYYSLLVVVVMQLLPETANKKYVKLYCGLVFLLVFFTPFLDFTGEKMEFQSKSIFYAYKQEAADMLETAQLYKDSEKKKIMENYGEALAEDVSIFLRKKGLTSRSVQVHYNMDETADAYGEIQEIVVTNAGAGTPAEKEIKKSLAEKYGVSQDRIIMQ